MRVQMKRIVCATDLSDFANKTIPFGVALAREFEARLFVCHIVDVPSSAIYGQAYLDRVDIQNQALEYAHGRLAQLIDEHAVNWKPVIQIGHTSDEIARVASEEGADLVIAATHGRSGLKRFLLGSVTERLMRTLPCPLLIVRGPDQVADINIEQPFRFKRILVGIDFSTDSALALKHALSLAQEFESELILAHVIEPPVYKELVVPSVEHGEELQNILHERLKTKLANMVPDDARNWCDPQILLLDGQSADELVHHAVVSDTDLIVLGSRGLSLVETLFVGSTTDRVARQAPCPVLSVRKKGVATDSTD